MGLSLAYLWCGTAPSVVVLGMVPMINLSHTPSYFVGCGV